MHGMLPKRGTISAAVGVAGVNSDFIVAALITPKHKLCCVAFGLRGAEVLIVCTIIDGLPCSAHVLRYAERKFNMNLHADQAGTAGQV